MDITTILVAYGILFIGELGDKTQLIVFNLALEYKKFYKVGIGVTCGFALIVTIGVFLGTIITRFVPLFLISFISGIVFIIIGIIEAIGLKKLFIERRERKAVKREDADDQVEIKPEVPSKLASLKKNPYITGFVYIFLMELGDKTQILTITLASIYQFPFAIWLGSFLALVSVAWIGILLGAVVARLIPKFYLKIISTSIFIIVGILILVSSF
ncbi:MAG: TMEM165/GDT1 family protein [Promethearchaeota archaeon]|jgi:putative Ca2+/H+ antiporter (TMEM165/GDT1 family)